MCNTWCFSKTFSNNKSMCSNTFSSHFYSVTVWFRYFTYTEVFICPFAESVFVAFARIYFPIDMQTSALPSAVEMPSPWCDGYMVFVLDGWLMDVAGLVESSVLYRAPHAICKRYIYFEGIYIYGLCEVRSAICMVYAKPQHWHKFTWWVLHLQHKFAYNELGISLYK